MNQLLCLGLGYSAANLCRQLSATDWQITGTSRTPTGAGQLTAHGWTGLAFDGRTASPALTQALTQTTHLVVSAGPDEAGDPVLRHHASDLAKASQLRVIVYYSTVGVYGDHQGAWVDETTVCRPTSARSLARLSAEEAWQRTAELYQKRLNVLRLAGIYGPGRNPLENLLAGEARRLIKPGQVFNRIHVDDIAAATAAALAATSVSQIINVTDDEPAPPQDVVAYAAELLGLPVPPDIAFDGAQLSPMARSFYGENKRVANQALKTQLGVRLRYPTYRQGLAALLPAILSRS